MTDSGDKKGFVRLNHFQGLRLETADFQIGESYHIDKKKLHNKVFHGYGVIEGYTPTGDLGGLRVLGRRRGDMSVEVTPGYAIDGDGNDVFLHTTEVKSVDASKYRLPADVFIILKYVDEPTNFTVNASNPKYKGHSRVLETSKVEIVAAEPDPSEGIELARVHLTSDVTEIMDAADPESPQDGEIDTRFRPRAGVSGSSLEPAILQKMREQLGHMRREFTHLGLKFRLHSARDIRDVIVSAQFLAHTNLISTQKDATTIMQLIGSLQEELLQEFQETYPNLTTTREFMGFKENVNGIQHILKNPKFTLDEFNSLLSFQVKAIENVHGVGEMTVPVSTNVNLEMEGKLQILQGQIEELKKAPPPPSAEEEDAPAAPGEAPKPKKKGGGGEALPGAKSVSWDELQKLSGELPDKIFMDGKNYRKNDEINLVDKKSESEHTFKMDGFKDKWSTNQTYKYPDGKEMAAKGQAHVGGYSQWEFKNLEADKDLIIAKRIDYAYSGLVTAISIDGQKVGEWKIEGQDRKFRWRNWLFKVPPEFVKAEKVTVKQESIDADREVNMFKLWCYQAID